MITEKGETLRHTNLIRDPVWLNSILEGGGNWQGGPVYTPTAMQIGTDYGFSGKVFRVAITTGAGPATIIAKIETPEKTSAAVFAHQHTPAALQENVPILYGYEVNEREGTLLLEDISPATQGDDLAGCSEDQASEIVTLVSRLHRATRMEAAPRDAPVFTPRISEKASWSENLTRAADRYPRLLTSTLVERLGNLPSGLIDSARTLDSQLISWIHVDPHLDNILWREDGSPVLVDWSNARVGPSVVDLAALLIGYSFRSVPAMKPMTMVGLYGKTVDQPVESLVPGVEAALEIVFIQGIVGWAGEEYNDGFPDRKAMLRDDAMGRAIRAVDWIDERPANSIK